MNWIQEHCPDFVDRESGGREGFSAVAELLALPFVASWAALPGFSRFSVARDGPPLLMAEMHDGAFWVVGHLDEDVDLPGWHRRSADS